jgi:monofunctional biosynthetic peptidoglycan transglycosylase
MKDRLRLVYRKFRKTVLILVIAQLVYILALRWIDPPITITQLGNWVSGNGLKRDYVNFEDMSPNIRLAVMASEDQLFPDHNGFDIKSIKKALAKNKKR